MNIRQVAWKNLIYNPFNTSLSILLMTFGVAIMSLILILNNQLDKNLKNNLRGIDMVIGAKGSPLQLIFSSIYHLDNPTGNILYGEAKKITASPIIDFTIPLSFGDSYNGFRIVGSTHEYPNLYEVKLREGRLWKKSMEVVVGSIVAKVNNLKIGDKFFGTHGFGESGHVHDNHSYEVVGILQQSSSIMDNLVLTDIQSVWEVHNEVCHDDHDHHDHGHHDHGHHDHGHHDHDHHDHGHHKKTIKVSNNESIPDQSMVTALLVKFKSPVGLIQLPRKVNETTSLQAAIPIFELNRLTNLLGFGIQTINFIALIIMLVSGLSIFISLYNSLKKRRYEIALMRVHGATKFQVIKLVLIEGVTLSFIGTLFGFIVSRLSLYVISILVNQTKMLSSFDYRLLNDEIWLFLISMIIGLLASLIPSILAYRINIPKTLSNA
tara:strand:- start:163 stop:1467 length:1305 start_codon:yes stop_codon:yes gene_type:complete